MLMAVELYPNFKEDIFIVELYFFIERLLKVVKSL